MADGWISIHRSLVNNWVWEDKPFDRGRAWIDLILMANWKDNKFLLGNELMMVERGSFITSELKLMDRWGWGKEKTRKFLKLLESDGMIIKKADRKKTTITIVNYSVYQPLSNINQTTDRPQADHEQTIERPRADTNNKENKENKENKKDVRHKYGEYKKVFLTDEQLQKLQIEFVDWQDRIQRLDDYIESTGKKYSNHLATIRNWAKNDNKKSSEQTKGSGFVKGAANILKNNGGIQDEQKRNCFDVDENQRLLPGVTQWNE